MRILISALLLLTLWAPVEAQTTQQPSLDSGEIPFEMVKNAIVIPVKINGKAHRFVLDTGGFFMVSKTLKQQGNLPVTDSITVSDATKRQRVFEKVLVQDASIGKLSFHDREAIVLFDNESYPNQCFGTDGMIGRDFFAGMILHFDYEKGILRLTEDESVFNLDERHKAKLKISERGIPDVLLRINGEEQFVEFDSGSGDFFSYKTKDVRRLKVKSKTDKLKYKGIFSFGVSSANHIKSTTRYRAKVYDLKLGGTSFNNFYSDLSKPTEPRIGASILYHGKVTVDYKNLAFYFEPYPQKDKQSVLKSFGFDIVYLNGEYLIKWVIKGSEAAKKGLKYGLKIKSINGEAIGETTDICEGYLNGYAFQKKEKVELEFFDKKGRLQRVILEKVVLD